MLLVTCEVAGKEYSTGLQVEKESLRLLPRNHESKAFCPYCREDHAWHVRDARYVDAIPPELWIENR